MKNRGFSLIELLIAVAILAIAIVPIMKGFVSSTKINSDTRGKLDATMVAEDLLEGIKKGNSHEKIITQLTDYISGTEEGRKNFFLFPEEIMGSGTKMNLILPSEAEHRETYTLQLKNLSAGSSNLVYDAEITLDPKSYREGDPGSTLNYNSTALTSLAGFGGVNDVVFNQDLIIRDLFQSELIGYAKEIAGETEVTFNDLRRKYTIDVQEYETGKASVTIATDYYYVPRDGSAETMLTTGRSPDTLKPSAGGMLENLYFFYYPGYDLHNMSDTIIINNPGDLEFNFYLLKQRRTDEMHVTSVYSDELVYATSSGDKSGIRVIVNSQKRIEICSNLDINAVDQSDIAGIVARKNDIFRWTPVLTAEELEAFNPFKLNPGEGGTDRIFDVTVTVYEEGYWDDSGDPGKPWTVVSDKDTLAEVNGAVLTH